MNLTQDRTQEIKKELADLNQSLKMSVQKAIRVGQLLTEQKEFIGHGKFISWIEDNLDITDETARKYIKLFQYKDKTQLNWNLQEAYQQIETIERQEKQSAEARKQTLIDEYKRTGKKPAGWDRSLDYLLQKEQEEEARREQRVKELKENMRREQEEKERRRNQDDLFSHATQQIIDEGFKSIRERQEWKEKIKISNNGKDDPFMDALMDYLETLEDDNRRIEACNNIIKICRNISVQLQKVKP